MKNNLEPYRLVNAQSMGATITSDAYECIAFFGLCIQAIVSAGASPTGSFSVQYSNDKVNWTAGVSLTEAVNPQAVTANGSFFWIWRDMMPMKWIRLVYTRTSGTGTLDVYISGVRLP
jgi:hypothetical protein